MPRGKIFQMRVQHAEQHLFVICRLRNFEDSFVVRFIGKGDPQLNLLGDEIDGV